MALESATFISQLVPTNPVAGDFVSQGDDHLRMIKEVLQATFPGLNVAVNLLPTGTIQHAVIELGHPTDTTFTRVVAGQAAIQGSRIFQRNNILGGVSQSGGVPTGAIFEEGSNSNGEYVRFADGTQICFDARSSSASASATWTYPVAFIANPVMSGAVGTTISDPCFMIAQNFGTTSVDFNVFSVASAGRVANVVYFSAIGRWF